MVYEQCLSERNNTLMNIFGHKIPENIPVSGTLLNITNGSLDMIMPELPYCDLEKELDNVSCEIELFVSIPFVRAFKLCNDNYSRHRAQVWLSSSSPKRSISFLALNSGQYCSS